MANIKSDASCRKKDPLAGFLAPKDLLDAYFAETGTRTENSPGQNSGIRQNRFPADSFQTGSAPLRILVGFSGGADSTALLDRLSRLPGYSVAAVHVNHGIRGEEAIRDREFCRGFCLNREIPFFCLDADVPAMRRQGESLETAARRVRYGYFAAVMKEQGYPLLAVAHNADDNLETVLFRICRGTGLRGLCGIPPVRAFGSGYLVRPLLGVSREEILRYLGERNLSYVTDSTNKETDAARNRLRLTVIPALRAATGDPVAGVTRMTRLLAADSRYLEAETTRLFSAGGDAGIPGTTACHPRTAVEKNAPEALSSPRAAVADDAGKPEFTSYRAAKHDNGFSSCTETACRNFEGYSAPSIKTGGSPAETPTRRFQGVAGSPAAEQSAFPLRLSRAALVGAPYPLASRAIARLMEAAGGDPSAVHAEALLAFLRSGTAHGRFPVPGNKNAILTVTYDDVCVTAARAAKMTSPAQGAATAENFPMPADLTTEQSGVANLAANPATGKPVSGQGNSAPAADGLASVSVGVTSGQGIAADSVQDNAAPAANDLVFVSAGATFGQRAAAAENAPVSADLTTGQSGAANLAASPAPKKSISGQSRSAPAADGLASVSVGTTAGQGIAADSVQDNAAPAQDAAEISGTESLSASGRTSGHAGQPDTTHKNSGIPPVGASDAAPGEPPFAEAVRIRDGETCRFGRFTVRRETVRTLTDSRSAHSDTAAPAENQAFPGRKTLPENGAPSPGGGYCAQNNAKIYNSLLRCAVRADKINKEVFIRAKLPGDRILTCGMHKEVRRLFSAARIPPGERDSYPLLCDGNGILAIPGIAVRDGCGVRGNFAVPGDTRACGGADTDGNSVARGGSGQNIPPARHAFTVFTFTKGLPEEPSREEPQPHNL